MQNLESFIIAITELPANKRTREHVSVMKRAWAKEQGGEDFPVPKSYIIKKLMTVVLIVLLSSLSSIVFAGECPIPDYTRDCNAGCLVEGDIVWYDNDCIDACIAEVKADIANYEKCLAEPAPELEPQPQPTPTPDPKPVVLPQPVVEPEPKPILAPAPIPASTPKPEQPEQTSKLIARTSYVEGEVWVTRKDTSQVKVKYSTVFYKGDTIASKGGVMTLRFSDGSKVIIGKDSSFFIGGKTEVILNFGYIKGLFKNLPGSFSLNTRGAVCTVRGTEFILGYDPETDISTLDLMEGVIDVTTNTGIETISAGRSVTFNETGMIAEETLTKATWKTLIAEHELKEIIDYVSVSMPISILVAIIGLIVYFAARKKIVTEKTSKFARSSLVLGLFSLGIGWVPFLGWILILLTFVFGFRALKQIKTKKLSGKKLAIIGFVMGFISLILSIGVLLSYV